MMKNIKIMNKIAKIGLDELDKNIFNISDDIDNHEVMLSVQGYLQDCQYRHLC